MRIDDALISRIKDSLRVKSSTADDEVVSLVYACVSELRIAGVYLEDLEEDHLGEQAIKLYCKARYGYDSDSEKFWNSYCALRDAMALSFDYGKKEDELDG